MKDFNQIILDLRLGKPLAEVCKTYKMTDKSVRTIRDKHVGAHSKLAKKLNLFPDFKNWFEQIHDNFNIPMNEVVVQVQNHSIFARTKVSQRTISILRKFYNIKPRMIERNYENDYDRIRGYIIRNSKYTAKRRGLDFYLDYTDFEIPEYCPILNIKLTYLSESDGNSYHHASLDRIDNNKGYIKGNVIVISRLANAMKNQASFDQIELFSKNMLKLTNHYKNQGALGSVTDVFEDFSPKLSLDY